MKYLKFTKLLTLLVMSAFVLNSCDKVESPEPMGDAGQTLVKILGAGTPAKVVSNPVDFANVPQSILAVDLRRDIPNETELNKTMVVVIKDDTAAVRAANPNYLPLPAAFYTISSEAPLVGGPGGTYTFTFKPGEFAKQIYINIPNATLLNPSALYGIGFTIVSITGEGKISTQKSVVIEIGAKNDWDGIYMNDAAGFQDLLFPAFISAGAQQYSLITVGASKCVVRNDDLNGGIPGYIFDNAGAGTFYGSYGLVISFNPATNAIADLYNYYGDPTMPATGGGNPALGTGPPLYASSNTRRATLDPSGVNAVQGNKDIKIKHFMLQPSVVPAGPRSFFNETWKYIGPR